MNAFSRDARASAAALLLLLAGLPSLLEGQQVLSECQGACGLELREVALLGESEGLGYVGSPRSLVRRSDGVFVLSDSDDQNRIKFFDPEGGYIRSFGRRGQGPAEFQTVGGLSLLADDAVEVHDLGNQRFMTMGADFSLEDVSSSFGLMARFTHPAPDGSRVVNAQSHLPDRIGHPLHWLEPDFSFEESFGARIERGRIAPIGRWPRPMARPTNRSVWVAHQSRYRLEEWGRDGQLLRSLERRVAWLEPWEGTANWEEDGKPRPLLLRIRLDAEGRIWTLVSVPGERWQEGLAPGPGLQGQPTSTIVDENALFATVVEVIDPERGVVLRSQRFDRRLKGFSADGQVYGLVEVDGGMDVRIAVWDLVDPASGGSGGGSR